ncbi:MAG: TonB-dependent receptor [Rhizorhabdus sp.]|nr:TonB-dependent receptor [Rhizorhabdus sp.]
MRALLAGSTALIGLLQPSASAAQGDAPAQAASAPETGEGLQEIIVTAQRREENLQKAALAVSAIAGNALTQQSVTQATDLSRLIPSIQIQPAHSYTQIYLRGVGTFGANSFAENSVAFNLDGVYLSRPAGPSGLFYDLERVEVLKGPQGTLYGRNATGGAINIITAKPKRDRFEGYANAEYGNYDTLKLSGAVNAPLGNAAALRIAGQLSQHDGYFSDGSDDERTRAVRGQILLAPEGSRFDMTISVDYAHLGGIGGGGTIVPLVRSGSRLGASDPRVQAAYQSYAPTAPVPQIVIPNAGSQDNSFFGAHATINVDLDFAKLTIVPAYRRTHYDVTSMSGGFVLDIDEKSHQTSVEARLAGISGPLNWVLGGYYFDEQVKSDQSFDQASNATLILSDLGTRSAAAFGQATYSLTDSFRLTGGLRYTRDEKEQDTLARSQPFVGFVPNVFPLRPLILDIPTVALTDASSKKLTWKAGVEFDAAPRSLVYASVSTGYKSGVLFPALTANISRPEKLTAVTLGSKNRFLDNRLQLNLEGFLWKYKDQQISHLGAVNVAPGIFGPVFITDNAGKLTIYGAEAELLFQVTPDDLLSANLQYLHTNYDSLRYQYYSSAGAPPGVGCPVTPTNLSGTTPIARIFDVDCSGRAGVNAPKWTLNLAYEHVFDLDAAGRIRVGADTRIQSGRYLTVDFLPSAYQDGFMKSNARITYETEDGRYALTAFVNNLENKFTYSGSVQSPVKNGLFYNRVDPPRTYGVRASLKF